MNKLKTDLTASFIIGVLAALFSLMLLQNLNAKIPLWAPFLFLVALCMGGILIARLLGNKLPVIYQFGKFGETGGLNVLIDFGVLNLLILIFQQSAGIYFVIFKTISFTAATVNSYIWNKLWVFVKKEEGEVTQEFSKFVLVTLIGLAINVSIASMVVLAGPNIFKAGFESKIWANLGAAFGALTAMMWNFVGYKFFVFKK